MTRTSKQMVGLLAAFGTLALLRAQSLPAPVAGGNFTIQATNSGETSQATYDYEPPNLGTQFPVMAEKLAVSSETKIKTTTTEVTVPAVPAGEGKVTITFNYDAGYQADHPDATRPVKGLAGLPSWSPIVSYDQIVLSDVWDGNGQATFELTAKQGTATRFIKGTGTGTGAFFKYVNGFGPLPPTILATNVTEASAGIAWLRWYPPGIDYRFLEGTAYYFTVQQPDGPTMVYHINHYNVLGEGLAEYYPIGELKVTGSPGNVGSPARSETHYTFTTETLDSAGTYSALKSMSDPQVFNDSKFELMTEPTAHYAFAGSGASASKLRYKLSIKPGLARTITWAETFTPDRALEPTDFAFVSEAVTATATETQPHIINPFDASNPHRHGSTPGKYQIVTFDGALSVDTNHDGAIVPAVGPITPYLTGHADTSVLGADLSFRPNQNDDVDPDNRTATTGGPDFANSQVDGPDDLSSFVPVYLDIGQLLKQLPPINGFTYKLKQADEALNFVYTNLTQVTAFFYLTNPDTGFGAGLNQPARSASTTQITQAGVDLFSGSGAFQSLALNNKGAVILIEARKGTDKPLMLEVSKGGTVVVSVQIPLAIFGLQLLLDANRNGVIDADGTDVTSVENPYHFWLNDDIDRAHTVDGNDSEEDDLQTSPNGKVDWENNYIPSKRDLEDFARLQISTAGLNDSFKNGQLYLGLKWTNITGTPAIKLYKHVETEGGLKYLTDETIAQQQINAAYAIADIRDTATQPQNATRVVIEGTDVFVLPALFFSGLSEAQPKTYLLFEGCKPGQGQLQLVILKKDGAEYTEIGNGPGVWMDLKKIGDMYEHWSVGQGPDPRGGGEPDAVAARIPSLSGSPAVFKYDNGSPSPEERKYILYVHGWNMERWEKERFGETAYKRLWWQGYKGRFGLFSWPTTNRFDPQPPFYKDAATDPTNYDRGEWAAWKSATPLRALLQTLHGPGAYGDQVYVLAHSMGNVVAGEALRLASQQGAGRLVNTYVASQAAIPVHVYDGSSTNLLDAIGPLGIAASTIDQFPQTPNTVYPDWLAGNGAAAGTRINFYNVNDFALWRDAWQLNQYMKPDHKDAPDQSWNYTFEDGLGAPPDLHSSFIRFDHYDDLANPVGIQEMQLGTQAVVGDRYEIMAFNAESRSKALGGTADAAKLTDSVNLQSPTVWPADTSGDARPYSRHKWHSAEFRSTNMRQQGYWKTLLGPSGFNLGTAP